jgi:PleD family two-component response regulator
VLSGDARLEELQYTAEAQLLKAKQAGRNRVASLPVR